MLRKIVSSSYCHLLVIHSRVLFHFLQKIKRQESNGEAATERTSCYGIAGDSLTCVISEQSLTLYEMLGNGAFGYVRRGKWLKDSRKKVIIYFHISAPFNSKQTLDF